MPSPSAVLDAEGSSRLVLLEVLRRGPGSRAELARRLGLSTASLTRLTRPMLDAGLLSEGAAGLPSGAGRPSLPLDVVGSVAHFVGVKLVGDAVHAVRTDLRGTVLAERTRALAGEDPAAVVEVVGRTVTALRRGGGDRVAAVGVAVGGPVDEQRYARRTLALGWSGVDLAGPLRERLGVPVVVTNDGHAFAQSEHWFGVGRDADPFLVVTIGFGVGCYLVSSDELLRGVHGLAGRVQHLPLDPDGPICPAGHHGCPEVLLTSAALARLAAEALGRPTDAVELERRAVAGDPIARAVLTAPARALGTLVGLLAELVDPARILVSGEGAGWVAPVRDVFDAAVAGQRGPSGAGSADDLVVAPLEFAAWARGAAVVALQQWTLGRLPA